MEVMVMGVMGRSWPAVGKAVASLKPSIRARLLG